MLFTCKKKLILLNLPQDSNFARSVISGEYLESSLRDDVLSVNHSDGYALSRYIKKYISSDSDNIIKLKKKYFGGDNDNISLDLLVQKLLHSLV